MTLLDWQPIETAPKDGTVIDLWVRDLDSGKCNRFCDCYWSTDRQQWHGSDELIWPEQEQPTHWMPLPEPPAITAGTRSAETRSRLRP